MKQCTKCNTHKDLNYFHKDKSKKDHLSSHCKECRKKQKNKYYYNNKDNIAENGKIYRETNQETIAENKKIYAENNKVKIALYQKSYRKNNSKQIAKSKKEWSKNNVDRVRKNFDRWYKENPQKILASGRKRRAKKLELNEHYTTEQYNITIKYFNYKCYNCKSVKNLCIDHHRPLSKNNVLSLLNAVILCKSCNSSKSDKNPEDFYGVNECKKLDKMLNKIASIYSINLD